MTMDLSEYFEIFYEEADELLASMEQLLMALDLNNPDSDDLNAIFRVAHSIKGGAATFDMGEITSLTHILENLLDRLRKGELKPTSDHVDAFLKAKDVLQDMIAARRENSPLGADSGAPIMSRLHDLAEQKTETAGALHVTPERTQDDPVAQVPAGSESVVDKALKDNSFGLYEKMPQVESAALPEVAVAPVPQAVAAGGVQVPAPATGAGPVQAVSKDVHHEQTSASGPKPGEKPKIATESSSIRVGVEKVDQLINQVGELVITHAMIEQLSKALDPILHEHLLNSIGQLARNARELQTSVLGIRMLPMDVVFSRFPRLVRDLAAKLGKSIDLVTIGSTTELDKSLTERLIDPLTHLVRNSIDHGIETREARVAAGKTPNGRLTLSAAHLGGSIVIEVTDDGAGLDRERILAKASQQGLAVSPNMSDEEVWQLIFAPGFSTAEVVTDVSGRGVGMDVVKRNITAMGGSVEITSARGYGSNIRIALPLTLAILDGMLVKVGGEIYIVALSNIVESLQPEASAIKHVMGEGALVRVRDEYLPLLFLAERFGIESAQTEPGKGVVVILESGGRKVGMMVDELVGQQQVVVKSLEANYRRVTGIAGATVLGDGSVALILDTMTLLRHTKNSSTCDAIPA